MLAQHGCKCKLGVIAKFEFNQLFFNSSNKVFFSVVNRSLGEHLLCRDYEIQGHSIFSSVLMALEVSVGIVVRPICQGGL